jgi:hypothetical protein
VPSKHVGQTKSVKSPVDLDLATLLADARSFRRLAVGSDPLRGLVLAPYIAMFAVESLACLHRRRMATGSFEGHAAAIEQSRNSLKFLDDSKRGVTAVVESFEQMGAANHRMFNGPHRGMLGPLKRLLQPDLSIFITEGRMIGTSHAAMVQTSSGHGPPPTTLGELRALGPELRERSVALGRYIAAILNAFKQDPSRTPVSADLPPVIGRDVKSASFYRRLVPSKASGTTGWPILIASLLSSVNFVLHALPIATGRDAIDRWFVFKWRLITMFHVHSSLQHITASGPAKEMLRPDVVRMIVDQRRKLRSLRNLKRVRDALVHYDLGKPSKDNGATPEERLATHIRTGTSSVENALAEVSVALARFFPL